MRTERCASKTGIQEAGTTTDCGRGFRRAVGQAGLSLTKLVVWIEEGQVELTPDLITRIEGLSVIIGRYGRASVSVMSVRTAHAGEKGVLP